MTLEPDNLVLQLLREIRDRQDVTDSKIGAIGTSMVSMRKEMDEMKQEMRNLKISIDGLRADMRMISIAVDDHTHRLDKIEIILQASRH